MILPIEKGTDLKESVKSFSVPFTFNYLTMVIAEDITSNPVAANIKDYVRFFPLYSCLGFLYIPNKFRASGFANVKRRLISPDSDFLASFTGSTFVSLIVLKTVRVTEKRCIFVGSSMGFLMRQGRVVLTACLVSGASLKEAHLIIGNV
jgi:hypothetical protein